jgi:hypothetical protein
VAAAGGRGGPSAGRAAAPREQTAARCRCGVWGRRAGSFRGGAAAEAAPAWADPGPAGPGEESAGEERQGRGGGMVDERYTTVGSHDAGPGSRPGFLPCSRQWTGAGVTEGQSGSAGAGGGGSNFAAP